MRHSELKPFVNCDVMIVTSCDVNISKIEMLGMQTAKCKLVSYSHGAPMGDGGHDPTFRGQGDRGT